MADHPSAMLLSIIPRPCYGRPYLGHAMVDHIVGHLVGAVRLILPPLPTAAAALSECVCLCVCVCAVRLRACVRACVRVRVRGVFASARVHE